MIFKNILKNLTMYRLHIFKILFFELTNIIGGYKGNRFASSKNKNINDNIPCPYFFLRRIKKKITNKKFSTFLDFGSGSGRVIDYFNRNIPNKTFIGIEYYKNNYNYCKKIFSMNRNIHLINEDFTKYDFLKHNVDCYFLNDPVNNNEIYSEILKKIINKSNLTNKETLLIFVNFDVSNFDCMKNILCIESYKISDTKGYSIYCISNLAK